MRLGDPVDKPAPTFRHRLDDGWLVLAFASLAALAASLSLGWAGIDPLLQGKVAGLLLVSTLAGSALIQSKRAAFPDRILYWMVSFLIGMFLLSFSAFILSQRVLFGGLSLAEDPGRLWWGFGLIGLLAVPGLWRRTGPPVGPAARGDSGALFIFAGLAVLIALTTHPDLISLSSRAEAQGDYYLHLIEFPEPILSKGMPPAVFLHYGLQLLLIQLEGQLGLGLVTRHAAFKVLSVLLYYVVEYSAYAMARYCFAATRRLAVLAGVASVLYSAIHPLVWDMAGSSYLGFYSPSGAFYHNSPQVFSHGMAATGLLLVGLAWKKRVRLFALGCALIAGSMYFKPSFIGYFLPALFLLLPFQIKELNRDVFAGYAALIAAPAGWIIYPWATGISRISNDYAFNPFHWSLVWIPQSFAYDYLGRPIAIALFATVLSFAFPVAVAFFSTLVSWSSIRYWLASLSSNWPDIRFEVLLLLFAAVSLFGGVMLVEAGDRIDFGNMTWGTASAYLSLLPWLMTLAGRIRFKPAQLLVWGLFALHILSGVRHLYRFVVYGVL